MSDNDTDKRFAVLLDGVVEPTKRLRTQLEGRRIIAADGGMRHADRLGVRPELWVGDFDSSDTSLQDNHDRTRRVSLPTDKDHSDGALSLQAALVRGANDIVVCGATGGPRSDHVLFNLAQIVATGRHTGCKVWAANGLEEHHVMTGPATAGFDFEDKTTFSVFPLGDVAGLTVSGADWPLENVNVAFGSTQTLSNRVHAPLRISVNTGTIFVIAQMA